MYSDRRFPDYINGMHYFLRVAEKNKPSNGFISCPLASARIRSITLTQKPFTSTCCSMVSCPVIIAGPSTEKEGL